MIGLLLLSGLFGTIAKAEDFKLGILRDAVDYFAVEYAVIKLAIKHAPGDHRLHLIPMGDAVQPRIFNELERGTIDMFFAGHTRERETRFLQIDFPLTRGLLGYRGLIIRDDDQDSFNPVKSLGDLREKVRIGSGVGWPESDLFRKLGMKLTTSDYDSLWPMLTGDRYDALHRGLLEILPELDQRRHMKVRLEENLMLHLMFDFFLYVRKNDRTRHDILLQGLKNAINNGSYDNLLLKHPQLLRALETLNPLERTIIPIPNPDIAPLVSRIPKDYWYDIRELQSRLITNSSGTQANKKQE
ncbi:hypothetical protein [Kiloniella sp. b19]|uniref:hypothetical protein n=1 Tax=Kiloniella sp. GXU_MW_B19 TaxID=3141326 RepID=UPI0031D32AC8